MRPDTRRLRLSLLLLAIGALGCGTPGSVHVPESVPREKVELPLVEERSEFSREWRNPGTDLRAYEKILLVPLELVYSERYLRNHRFEGNRFGRAWPPKARLERQRASDLAQMRKLFRDALQAELQRDGGVTLVDEPGPGVLSLSVGVLDLDLTRSQVEQNATGLTAFDRPQTVTIVASLRDGTSAEHLGVMLQPRWTPGTIHRSGAGSALWGSIRTAFDHWARDFRALLEQPPTVPAAPSLASSN